MTAPIASPAPEAGDTVVTCPYCRAPIATERFSAWPREPRLITGDCTGCGRTLTLPTRWVAAQRGPLSLES